VRLSGGLLSGRPGRRAELIMESLSLSMSAPAQGVLFKSTGHGLAQQW